MADKWRDKRQRNKKGWKIAIIDRIFESLGATWESRNYFIFQELNFSSHHFKFFKRDSHTYAINSPYIWLSNSESYLFCKTCPVQFIKFPRHQIQTRESLLLYFKQIHKNFHLAKVVHEVEKGVSKTVCRSQGGRNDSLHDICLFLSLSQHYNYSIHFLGQKLRPNETKIVSRVKHIMATIYDVNKFILKEPYPPVWVGVGTDQNDYNFQVFTPTRVPRTSSITGLLSPFDIPTWIAFAVTILTTSVLFWIILCPKDGERIKSLLKGVSWLLLTLLEQSVEPLKCKKGRGSQTQDKKERIRNWSELVGCYGNLALIWNVDH